MKKIIIILIIFIFCFVFRTNNINYNRKYIDYNNNTFIEYPKLKNNNLDNEINRFTKTFMKDYDYLFVDYDYINDSKLTMYIYKENDNVSKYYSKIFEINKLEEFNYDVYNWNFVDKRKLIALTFDDGPNYNTNKVLDILEKYEVRATFFILGSNINGNEKIIKRINDLGMEIGNHMYSHKITTRLSTSRLKEEIDKTDKLIYDITNKYPTLIRPSYGIYNNKLKKLVDRPIVLWNIDTLDWKYHNSRNIADRVFKGINRGNIILMHDIYSASANSLEIIIPKLLSEGFGFVTVSELFYYEDFLK